MAEQKPVEIKGTSPKGRFRYPYLITPDFGTKEHPIDNGQFAVRLIVDEATAEAFTKKLQPVIDYAREQADEKFAALKPNIRAKLKEVTWNDVAQPIYDNETEEPTGEFEFRFKTAASGLNKKTQKKWERKIPLFDAKGKPIKKIDAIWGGTIGKVSFIARDYFVPATGVAGVTLYLEAAQIINLVAGGSRDAEGYGFGEEEGYEADNSSEPFDDEDDGNGYAADDSDDDGNEDF